MNDSTLEQLWAAADEAKGLSHSPYSNFRVGAAILLKDGSIVKGANVENVSLTVGICAERSALITARMLGHKLDIIAVAVASDTTDLVSPCGACRQFLAEFCQNDTVIYMRSGGKEISRTLGELLPLRFERELE